MFKKILIANRGEIACRVAATARRLGMQTVAVYSEADAGAKHVAACDEAVLVGPAAAKESYLRADKIIAAALATGAQAIHPGYGFLSENEDFAEQCAKAGLVFIGPPASAIRAMGSKSAAKALMESADVPLVPGYHGDNQEPAFLRKQADAIGYPVLLKASAGGGGKGMRVVSSHEEFDGALESCKREALNSFGDDHVLVEKYLTRPRHIEIQVFADTHGNCVYLFERDCSVQRRHQKVLEEAPAPNMPEARRRAMGQAAVNAAKAVGYVGAGTVEFIANQDGTFYFMEMNTRLQVEHPVTEMITGTDLVEWQLRVAAGEPLPLRQDELKIHGHALEARIYAENPEKGFLPSTGALRRLATPEAVHFALGSGLAAGEPAAVRIDSGVREGDAISPFYDPMIAKLIVWGRDRDEALARMAHALAEYQIVGLACNVAFLKRLVESDAFAQADLDTGLIERHRTVLFPEPQAAGLPDLALAGALLLEGEAGVQASAHAGALPRGAREGAQGNAGAGAYAGAGRAAWNDVWNHTGGWRMNGRLSRKLAFAGDAGPQQLAVTYGRHGWTVQAGEASAEMTVAERHGAQFTILLDGALVRGSVVRDGNAFHVFRGGRHSVLHYDDPLAHAGVAESEGGRLTAPMPGKIVALLVEPGAVVEKGAPLLIMEAMKMEHTIAAPAAGTVEQLLYAAGDQVSEGAQLLGFKVKE